MGETLADKAESENLRMRQDSNRENREIPLVSKFSESEAVTVSSELRGA